MKRILFGAGTLVLVVAMFIWPTASSSAPRGGGHGGGGHGGGGHGGGGHAGGSHAGGSGHAPAHVGSVHYGARPIQAMAGRGPVRTGSVRSQHYIGSGVGGGYRNPYSVGYFGNFLPGYFPFVIGGVQYYGYYNLPFGYQQVVLNGMIYYLFNGVYYQPYMYGGQTVYLVAPIQ